MKKVIAALALLALGACSSSSPTSGLDINTIITDAQQLCSFTPAAAGVIALINAQSQSNSTQSASSVAAQICSAVNGVNPPVKIGKTAVPVRRIAPGTDISVVIQTPSGPVTIAGTVK